MAFMVKSVVGGQLKNLTGGLGGGEEKGESEKTPAEAHGMTREEYEEYQKQLVEEKMERDAQFAQRKAERATLRTHFRDKYRLPKRDQSKATQNRNARAVSSQGRVKRYQNKLALGRILNCYTLQSTESGKPKNESDDNQIQLVGGDVELPKELAKMIEQDNEEEEEKDSVIGQLTNIQNLDLDSLKDKAQATLDDLKQTAEKCILM